VEAEEGVPDILRIPRPLQESFFELARREADRVLREISAISEPLKRAYETVRPHLRKLHKRVEWREKVFAVVDGSDTPSIDERIGIKFGLVAVCRKHFKGIDQLSDAEWFAGDALRGSNHVSKEDFSKVLDLVTTYLERYYAVKALEDETVDFVVIDGSFWGFRAGCSRVKRLELGWTDPVTHRNFDEAQQLIDELVRLTRTLLQSGRAFGVVKRVATSSIDGYVAYKSDNAEVASGLTDRSLLTLMMDVGEVLDLNALFGDDAPHEVFSALSGIVHEKRRRERRVEIKEAYAESWKRVETQIVTDLLPKGPEESQEKQARVIDAVLSTRRVFVRTVPDQPPACLEFPKGVDPEVLELALSYALDTANPATGLPIALDLVDELISLPRGIGREFVEEVEGILLAAGIDVRRMRAFFSRINPQKEIE
jgi:hypothetical protein